MMKKILKPIMNIVEISGAPISLSLNDDLVIIDIFTDEEKKDFFEILNFKLTENGVNYKPRDEKTFYFSYSMYNHKLADYLRGNYKITINSKDAKKMELYNGVINFVFGLICGIGVDLDEVFLEEEHNPIKRGGIDRFFNRKIIKIDSVMMKKISQLVKLLVEDKYSEDERKKIKLLEYLFNLASSQAKKGIRSSLYVSILESIFSPDKGSEIAYRFSMRFAKFKKENYVFFKHIKKLYNNRSEFFHSGKDNFKNEDVNFLEEQVSIIIEKYIKTPKAFNSEELDLLLCK